MVENDFLTELKQKRLARGPQHFFPDMSESERLSYEKLTNNNYSALTKIFKNDSSVFVDSRFKNLDLAEKYAMDVVESVYDSKYGGCDFLIKLKNSETYVGVLHLFDYSLENFSDVPLRCSIGFAIAEPYRRNYYATEAVRHLIEYAQNQHGKAKFLAYTNLENKPANDFLLSLDMVLQNEEYYYGGQTDNYYVWKTDSAMDTE